MAPIVVVSQTPAKPARDNPNLVPEHVVYTHNDWLKHGVHEYGARQSIVGGLWGISDTKSKIGALPSLSAPQTQQLWPKIEFIEYIQRNASRIALAITSFERTPLMRTGIIKQQIHTWKIFTSEYFFSKKKGPDATPECIRWSPCTTEEMEKNHHLKYYLVGAGYVTTYFNNLSGLRQKLSVAGFHWVGGRARVSWW